MHCMVICHSCVLCQLLQLQDLCSVKSALRRSVMLLFCFVCSFLSAAGVDSPDSTGVKTHHLGENLRPSMSLFQTKYICWSTVLSIASSQHKTRLPSTLCWQYSVSYFFSSNLHKMHKLLHHLPPWPFTHCCAELGWARVNIANISHCAVLNSADIQEQLRLLKYDFGRWPFCGSFQNLRNVGIA